MLPFVDSQKHAQTFVMAFEEDDADDNQEKVEEEGGGGWQGWVRSWCDFMRDVLHDYSTT